MKPDMTLYRITLTPTMTTMPNSTRTQYAFYIPRIYGEYTATDIIHSFRLLFVGEVSRVDITEIGSNYFSAFIHMEYLYDNPIAKDIIDSYERNTEYRLWVEPTRYWILAKNLNPVQHSFLNTHQLAENSRLLEERVKSLEDRLEQKDADYCALKERVKSLEDRLELKILEALFETMEERRVKKI
tara:strand:+ start:3280 stop:3834 length:555 start_codon:yes stop_codon:yes gene_type:complete